jgi:NADH-quinone oxidoreductase subunit J
MFPSIIFYCLASVLLASGVAVVSVRNPVYAVLFLILCFFNASGLFLLMGAEFLAFILLIVYVGAVAVLFLFVVMMLDVNFNASKQQFRRYVPIGFAVALVLLAELTLVASGWVVDPEAVKVVTAAEGMVENTRALGRVLFTDYVFPFHVCGFILLVSMMGAIVLTLRGRRDSRHQVAARQTNIEISDVIEIKKVTQNQGVEL